jgi:hypothetical protein
MLKEAIDRGAWLCDNARTERKGGEAGQGDGVRRPGHVADRLGPRAILAGQDVASAELLCYDWLRRRA